MELAPMRYKDFVWPHNPRTYTIKYRRAMGEHKVPFGRYHLQDLGPCKRVMKGEGEFVGPKAYEQFKELASVFYADGPGVLIHPVWQTAKAYFVQLALAQEPRRDYVRYTFSFWESYDGYNSGLGLFEEESILGTGKGMAGPTVSGAKVGEVRHRVRKGESLWKIARDYGVELSQLLTLNPGIKNPNLIYPGQEVRVK